MKLKIYRHGHDPLTLEFGNGNNVYITILDKQEALGELCVDRYGRELRVHTWDKENVDGDPIQTIKLADMPARSILECS